MSKRKDPAMLANFRFLPEHLKAKVRNFVNLLEEPCRQFAILRYLENKNLSNVAEEMDYAERSLYNIRDSVIDRWEFYDNNNNNEYEKHQNMIIRMIQRHGSIEHFRLKNNTHRSGLNHSDFIDILRNLVASGVITCFIKPNLRGRPSRKYRINNNYGIVTEVNSVGNQIQRATHNA